MPLFDYICKCSHKTEEYVVKHDEEVICERCKGIMEKQFPTILGPTFPSEGITLDNVEATPKHFSSKKEMRDYAKKNNLELGALL